MDFGAGDPAGPAIPSMNLATHPAKWIFSGLCTLVLLTASPPVAAAQEPTENAGMTLKVSSVVVNVYAVVQDRHGRLVSDLGRDDFEVRQDGVEQPIEYFSRETEMPLTLALAIDTSPSQTRLLKTEMSAADHLLHSVVHADDRAFVLRFDDQVAIVQDATADPRLLSEAVEHPESGAAKYLAAEPTRGGTRLYDAVEQGAAHIAETPNGRRVLVLVTDGQDEGSIASLSRAIAAAQAADLIVYAVLIHDPEYYLVTEMKFRGDRALDELTRQTGGRVIRADQNGGTSAAFAAIAQELHAQYFLGFSPRSDSSAGYHKIAVRLRNGSYRVRARDGYYTPQR